MQTPYPGRAVITGSFNDVVITILAKKNWTLLVFIAIWFFGCAAVAVTFPGGMFNHTGKDSPDLFMTLWTIGFAWVSLLAGMIYWWSFAGKEVITFAPGVLTIEKKGSISKTKTYDLGQAHNFRSVEDPMPEFGLQFGLQRRQQALPKPWNIADKGTIRFDYGLATVKFGDRLYQAEGDYILEQLREKRIID
jgi:hypothetical protein